MIARNMNNSQYARQRIESSEVRRVIAMTVPVVLTTSSRALMDVADYVMITLLRQNAAQAAMLPAQMLMWSYIVLGMGIVAMVNTFCSQALGRRQHADCSAYAWQSLYIAGVLGLIGLAVRPLLPALIHAIGHDEDVRTLELAYLNVALLSVAPTIASNGLSWFFVGVHRPWVATWSVIESNVVNILVSSVLIFGFLGFPPMGIAGAAWGTFIALIYRTVRLALAMVTPTMASTYSTRSMWRPSWHRLRNLLRVGLPFGIQSAFEIVVWAIFVNVLVGGKFGTAHLIATNAAWQYMRVAFMPCIGVGQALTALVGNSIGMGHPARAQREARLAAGITLAYMGALSTIYAFWGAELIGRFNGDHLVMEIGGAVMMCAAVFQLFDAVAITYGAALRGAGDTFVPSVVFTACNWVIIVGGGWLAATYFPRLGSIGPWITAAGLIIVAAGFFWWRWRSGVWMKIDLFRDAPAPGITPVAETAGATMQ